jgi:arsenical pump membrane protein
VEHFLRSLENSWQPFVLVIGLLLVGHSAASEGLFDWLGRLIARTPGGALRVFVVTMLAVAVVTATLNLDTAIVFMTPVALQAARSSKADQDAFLYGTILMTNSASLLLYGSNLTNLLVFSSRSVAGTTFASHMLLPWVGAVVITIAVVGLWRWRSFRGGVVVRSSSGLSFRFGIGALAVLLSVAAMLALRDPALPVLVIGVVAAGNEVLVKRKMRVREVLAVASPYLLGPLFALAVLVGWLGRSWHRVGHLVAHTSSLTTSLIGAGTSLVINNLPAASLFSGQSIAHPYALLLGLNLGPNIFVTGSLSSMLWFRLARSEGARPSLRTFVTIGPPVALLTIFVGSLFV